MATQRTVIPLTDYKRIFGVMAGVLEGRARTAHACVFFALAGAMILEEKYKINACPRAGAALYMIDAQADPARVHLFGRVENDVIVSAKDAFHCWIEANGVVIDFMAPLFQASMRAAGATFAVPSRMFQKPLSEMSPDPEAMQNDGDFLLQPDGALAKTLFAGFEARPSSMDLLHACLTRYVKPPKALRNMAWSMT